MMTRIGIPRALTYYQYFPLWNTFFEGLGFAVVVSKPGHRGFLQEGFKFADDDTCLPIKMAFAHTFRLKEQVDFLFIPRLLSLEPGTCFCPRLAGLPEMLKYSIPNLPPILNPYVDERYRHSRLFHSLSEMAAALGKSAKEIKQAFYNGQKAYQDFRERMERGEKVAEIFPQTEQKSLPPQKEGLRKNMAIVGHPYCLYDPYFNFNLIQVLEEAYVSIYTQEMVSRENIELEIRRLGKDIYWTSGREILGASLYYLRSKKVDGLIYLTCFACGVDSMIEPLVRHRLRENRETLYLCLMVDEHTSPAGFLTRVEAFLETVDRRKTNRQTQ